MHEKSGNPNPRRARQESSKGYFMRGNYEAREYMGCASGNNGVDDGQAPKKRAESSETRV